MKTNLILLAVIALGSAAYGQNNNQEPFLIKSLKGMGIKDVFVNTSGGSISVSGTTEQEPRVEVFVNGNNGRILIKEEAKQRVEKDYTLVVEAHDGELHAEAKSKRRSDWDNDYVSISFKVFVPAKTATNLNTSGGSIHIDNLAGNETFTTSGGSLNIDHVTGIIKGRTSGGSIHVSDSKQNIDLETSGGSVSAENCQGEIRLETSGGSLNLNRLAGNISATTSGGSVLGDHIMGDLKTGTSGGSVNLTDLACSLDASTSAGSLHAQFKEVKKYVKLDVSAGHIDVILPSKQGLDLDLRGNRVSDENLANFSGDKDKEHIHGKVNGGGASVRADAGSGRVSVSFN